MSGIIPLVPGEPEQVIDIALGDQEVHLRVRWNSREAKWYLDVFELDGKTPIATGIALVLGVLLGRRSPHPLFAGALFLVDDGATAAIGPRDAGLFDLGGRVTLWYLDPVDRALASDPDLPQPPPSES